MGVVHRDLKPEQLLVCSEDKSELKIAVQSLLPTNQQPTNAFWTCLRCCLPQDFGLGKMYPLPDGVDGPERDAKSVHHGIIDAASVGDHAVQLPICRYWADKDDVGGTPAFMAPEVFALWKEDEPTKDLLDAEATELLDRSGYPEGSVPLRGYDCVPVDVWGCALVLFWLMAGTHPFNLRTRPCQWWFKRVMNRDRSAFWEYVTSQGVSLHILS
jgi:serine/threonine protein kinase